MSSGVVNQASIPFKAARAKLMIAAVLFIFVGIANFTLRQIVPRHLRFIEVTTEGLGPAISGGRNPRAVYGNPDSDRNVRSPGDGLRVYYTWGLWNRCAGFNGKSHPQYCDRTRWAYRFEPTKALMEDLPAGLSDRAAALFNNRFSGDHYLGHSSRIAFYFIFIAACLTGAILIMSLASVRGPGRLASFSLAALSLLAFLSGLIGTTIWTAIAGILKHQLNNNYSTLGMGAHYGNALWLLWAIDLLLLLTTLSFIGSCIAGRRRTVVV